MFVLLSLVAACIVTAIEIIVISDDRSPRSVILTVIRNLLSMPLASIAVQKYIMRYEHFLTTEGYNAGNYIKFFFVSLVVSAALETLYSFVNRSYAFEKAEPSKKKKGVTALKIIAVILVFLGSAAYFGTVWGKVAFGDVTGDQLIINLTSPTEGTESSVYTDGFEGPVFNTLLVTVAFALLIFSHFSIVITKKNKTILSEFWKRTVCCVLSVACLVGGVVYGFQQFKLEQVYNAYIAKSDIIDKNFVNPETANITFPEKKRNLIHIYLESIEVSFLSKELGGNINRNLMPKLTKLAENGIVFSHNDNKFGGPVKGTGTQWSIASMVNQTSGLPMKAPGMHNGYGTEGNFLPGAYTLGELLEKEGYEQTVMFGASAQFGGLGYYYQTHGNWKVMDYDYVKEHNMLPSPDYKVWWGFEDDKLYEFAKDEITRMYKTGKPFNFTMEDADTHRPGGYITPGKKTPFKSHYANAIWNSDRDVYRFVKWIMKQPFYENTTVILIGDHISMDTEFFKEYKFTPDYDRRQFNLILNPDPSVAKVGKDITNNRKWANWDMFPTIVSSLGARIEGERLGIGTNLFSGAKTIYEENNVQKVNKELEKSSKLYNEKILGGKGFEGGRTRTKYKKPPVTEAGS